MITNATLLRIDTPAAASSGGDAAFTTGGAVSIRCCRTDPTYNQRYTIEQAALDANTVIYLAMSDVQSLLPVLGAQLSIQGDEEIEPQLLEVRKETHGVKAGGLSYVMLFARAT